MEMVPVAGSTCSGAACKGAERGREAHRSGTGGLGEEIVRANECWGHGLGRATVRLGSAMPEAQSGKSSVAGAKRELARLDWWRGPRVRRRTSPLVCCIRREPVRSACGGGG
eukprot:scaffold318259_cov28-Tisochrysis_lutea.AAC.2